MKLFLASASLLILTACGNSGNFDQTTRELTDKKESGDSTHTMEHSSAVPDVPAVPEGAKVYFSNLKNDQNISSPFKVQMAADNIRVDTIGPVVAGSGHFHIFIDAEDSLATGKMVPTDSSHLHYGRGQKEAELKLSPGKHKLTLQFADGIHRSYGNKLSSTVTVNVKQ